MNPLGATLDGRGGCRFRVWAPLAQRVDVRLVAPVERVEPLQRSGHDYFEGVVEDVAAGARYVYRLDGKLERPDPASRSQPEGVHRPSEVVSDEFAWTDSSWHGRPWPTYLFYELHVGLYTAEGTLDAILPRLDELVELGVTAVELMPVAQFPGRRNWGYDGTYPFAVQNTYGGPLALKRLVDACHARGLAVVLDVVYNHLGPEGNYLWAYGPYFTDRYRTPWGHAVNFDGEGSDDVRRYFIENALQWIRDFHVDALRLDALHAIVDESARPFLEQLAEEVHGEALRLDRAVYLVAEVDRNDPKFVRGPELGGFGLDAQWNDDFHHGLHTLLTGERSGYYEDFGTLEQMALAFSQGYVYTGQRSSFRRRSHGRIPTGVARGRLVDFAQNHDQVGNRMLGERLTSLVDFERLKLAAVAVLLSPGTPLLFMGEEYGETAPFLYFVDHSDPGLIEAVRNGRREEFRRFGWAQEPPDPQSEKTFESSRPDPARARAGRHQVLRQLHRDLIALRRSDESFAVSTPAAVSVHAPERVIFVVRSTSNRQTLAAFHFGPGIVAVKLPPRGGRWRRLLDTSDGQWLGPGARGPVVLDLDHEASIAFQPWSAAVFETSLADVKPAAAAGAVAEPPP